MKKIISCFIVILLVTLLSSCGYSSNNNNSNSENSSAIQLTTDNASDYFTFDIEGGGTDLHRIAGEYQYKSVYFKGTISGIPGYTYNDVTITLSCEYSANIYPFTLSDTTSLNKGGNGSVSAGATLQRLTDGSISYYKNIESKGYTVTSISGYVTKD